MSKEDKDKKTPGAEPEEQQLDPKLLKGLKYLSSEALEVKGKDGRKGKKHTPTSRALKPEDVLSWKDNGETVVIVTADGQKHTVEK